MKNFQVWVERFERIHWVLKFKSSCTLHGHAWEEATEEVLSKAGLGWSPLPLKFSPGPTMCDGPAVHILLLKGVGCSEDRRGFLEQLLPLIEQRAGRIFATN